MRYGPAKATCVARSGVIVYVWKTDVHGDVGLEHAPPGSRMPRSTIFTSGLPMMYLASNFAMSASKPSMVAADRVLLGEQRRVQGSADDQLAALA